MSVTTRPVAAARRRLSSYMKDAACEDRVTSAIERKTSFIPSTLFLVGAMGALGAAVALNLLRQKSWSVLAAQLAPTFLILGLYNKVVKQHGH